MQPGVFHNMPLGLDIVQENNMAVFLADKELIDLDNYRSCIDMLKAFI